MSEEIFLSAIVIGELLYGFQQGSRIKRNIGELQSFLDSPYVTFIPATRVTADYYSRIGRALRAKGRPIPSNDIWIAAHALETGAISFHMIVILQMLTGSNGHPSRLSNSRQSSTSPLHPTSASTPTTAS